MNRHGPHFLRLGLLTALFVHLFVTPAKALSDKRNDRPTDSQLSSSTTLPNGASTNKPVADKWALVIGVGSFADPTIPKLRYAAKDAKDFADFLVKDEHFAVDHVRILIDSEATQRRILTELGDKFLPRVVKPGDLVLIYFSGHGSPSDVDVKSQNYIVAYDSEKSNLFASGIDVQDFTKLIKARVDTDRVVIILDACHSGSAEANAKGIFYDRAFDPESAIGAGQMVICSSTKDERSWESKRYQNGVFTRQLIASMQRDGANAPLGKVFHDMQESVHDEVQQDQGQKQNPLLKSQWVGEDPVLGAIPQNPRQMPESVKQLLEPTTPGTNTARTSITGTASETTGSGASNDGTDLQVPPHSSALQFFSPPDRSFRAKMPGPVKSEEFSNGPTVGRQYFSKTPTVTYYVSTATCPPGSYAAQQFFTGFANSFLFGLARSGARYLPVGERTVNGHRAAEYRYWSALQQGRLLFVSSDKHVFAFSAYVPNPGKTDVIDGFFSSISIE